MLVAALALGSLAAAAPASAPREDSELATLDATLSTLTAHDETGPHLHGFIRSRFAWSDDVDTDPGADEKDLAGFSLDNVRVSISGDAGHGFSYLVSVEAGDQLELDTFDGTGVGLLDAYVDVAVCDTVSVRTGQFCAMFLPEGCMEERYQTFLDRSFLGEIWDNRDLGVQVNGNFDKFHAWLAAQNGFDGQGDDFALSARASFDVLGQANCMQQCSMVNADATELSVGVAWFDDHSFEDGMMLGGDVWFHTGSWIAQAEIIDFDDDMQPGNAINPSTGTLIPGAGASFSETAWNASLAYLFPNEQWEVAGRFQDLDDDADTTIVSACVNRYVQGNDIKWTLQVDSANSDDDASESDAIAVGLTVGF